MTIDEMYQMVGDKKYLLQQIVEFIHTNYGIDEEFKYYKKSGWCLFYRKSGKSLAIINPINNGFQITIVIGSTLHDSLRLSGVSDKIMTLFETAYQFHDGRWLNFSVKDQQDIEDIKKLILVKKKPLKSSKKSEFTHL